MIRDFAEYIILVGFVDEQYKTSPFSIREYFNSVRNPNSMTHNENIVRASSTD
jgi:hypothetical protein